MVEKESKFTCAAIKRDLLTKMQKIKAEKGFPIAFMVNKAIEEYLKTIE